jgi:hypothetical protein
MSTCHSASPSAANGKKKGTLPMPTNPAMTSPETVAAVAELTEAQRNAIIKCVDALAELAGEGFCVAEDAIHDLFDAFDGDSSLEYEVWIRDHLRNSEGSEG